MRAQEMNPAKMAMLFRKQFEMCNVHEGETIALLSDLNSRTEYVAAAFAAGADLGADVYEMKFSMCPPLVLLARAWSIRWILTYAEAQ